MTKELAAILRRVRQRPLGERRVLAVTAYIAAASLITMVWAASLKESLNITSRNIEPVAIKGENNDAKNIPRSAELSKTTASASNPKTPLETLSAALKALASGAKEFNQVIGDLKKNLNLAAGTALTPAQAPNQDTSGYLTGDETDADFFKPETNRTASAKIVMDRDPNPDEIIAINLAEKSYSDSNHAAELLLPTPELAKISAPKRKRASRIAAIINYNLGEMRKTAIDFFEYLRQ